MLDKFNQWYKSINKNKSGDTFSPHKPLTIVFALAKALKGERWIDYTKDRQSLEDLIWEFTNLKSKPNCLQPLWRLQNDSKDLSIWEVSPASFLVNASGDISVGQATEKQLKAGFADEIYEHLQDHPWRAQSLIGEIIEDNFPETLTESILVKLGLDELAPEPKPDEIVTNVISKPKRDPNFPKKILALYDYRCCFCGLKVYLNQNVLPMEAAHIKWKAQGGDCTESNGLALCPTHHFTFDRGLWSLNEGYKIELSEKAVIDEQSDPFFAPFIGKSVSEKILDKRMLPTEENLQWHRKNILK